MSGGSVRGALIRLIAFTVASAVIALLLFNTLTNSVGSPTASYSAMFTDASGLHEGDNVRVAGVRVGRVERVELAGTLARVDFTVAVEQPVLRDTTVAIRYQNLIGQRFLALVPGGRGGRGSGGDSREPLPPGSEIGQARTQNALDLTVVTNGFQPLFEALSPDDINQLSVSLVRVLQGEGGSITSLLRTTAELSTRLADRDQVIGRVVDNLATVLGEVGERDGEVDVLIAQLRRLATATAADRAQIGGSIAALSGLTDATTDLLRDVRPQLRDDVAKLARVTATYAREQVPFADAIRGLPVALSAFARQMQYGSWVNLYICNLVISRPGQAPQAIGNTGANSEVCR